MSKCGAKLGYLARRLPRVISEMTKRPAAMTQADAPLSMDRAAQTLGVSRRWLQDFIRDNPVTYLAAGRKKLFDERALNEIREAMRKGRVANPAPSDGVTFQQARKILDDMTWASRRNRPGFVYFVSNGEAIKIGFAQSVERRIAELQISSSARLELLAVVSGDERLEASYHKQFAALRVSGEWFAKDDRLLNLVAWLNVQATRAKRRGSKYKKAKVDE